MNRKSKVRTAMLLSVIILLLLTVLVYGQSHTVTYVGRMTVLHEMSKLDSNLSTGGV